MRLNYYFKPVDNIWEIVEKLEMMFSFSFLFLFLMFLIGAASLSWDGLSSGMIVMDTLSIPLCM